MASDDTSPRTSPAPSPPEKPKGISRKKKSASQTEVLEKAYAVEKYPSEATRALLGKELDLSDKQLQIWFTHRRFKDRRDGIHDEKLTFYAKNKTAHAHPPAEDFRQAKKQQQQQQQQQEVVPNTTVEEEDDSEPDGYPARVLAEERDDEELIAEHKHSNGVDVPTNGGYGDIEKMKPGPKRKSGPRLLKDPNRPPQRPGPKPKFNAMAAAERAAIAAVESQLCGPLRDDGPPLGFEFDPLPPRAFSEMPITEVPHNTAGVSRESGSENHSERAALQTKWAREIELAEKELAEKKRRKIGLLKPSRGENGY